VGQIGAGSVQQCLALTSFMHDYVNRFLACLCRGLDPMKAIG
jgi:hypothetical protein